MGVWKATNTSKNCRRRIYVAQDKDASILDLAKQVKLDEKEFNKWGFVTDYRSWDGEPPHPFIVSVPNTCYLFIVIKLRDLGWRFRIPECFEKLKQEGYAVIVEKNATASKIINCFKDKNIYGACVIAHGEKLEKGSFASTDKTIRPQYLKPPYKLGLLQLFVCWGALKDNWKKLVSKYGDYVGYKTKIRPFQKKVSKHFQ